MKKIIFSLMTIAVAGALVIGGTTAFFSDEEASEGNTFTAGSIDLVLTNEHSTSGNGIIDETVEDWADFDDVNDRVFFDFADLKPGDWGENTIGLQVEDNDAWLCASVAGSEDENTLVEPEEDMNDDATTGEMGKYLTFVWWTDDGDNVLEEGETVLFDGPIKFEDMMASNNLLELTLADSYPWNIFNDNVGPILGATPYHVAVAWCFGDMTLDAGADEWITCDGASVENDAQTDMIEATLAFEAYQSRNNDDFLCPDTYRDLGGFPEVPSVGANFEDYTAPLVEECDATVVDGELIQTAVDAATAGDTICVDSGVYDETVTIAKALTLVSTGGPASTIIGDALKLTADDITVKGFTINDGVVGGEPNPLGIYLGSGSNISIDSNIFNGNDAVNSSAILLITGASYSNVNIENNQFSNWLRVMYSNPHTGIVNFNYNDVEDIDYALAGFMGVDARYNEFDHSVSGNELAGVDSSYDSNPGTLEFNNILGGYQINIYGTVATTVDAPNNFFNLGGSIQASAGVDYTPEAVGPYAHN